MEDDFDVFAVQEVEGFVRDDVLAVTGGEREVRRVMVGMEEKTRSERCGVLVIQKGEIGSSEIASERGKPFARSIKSGAQEPRRECLLVGTQEMLVNAVPKGCVASGLRGCKIVQFVCQLLIIV